MKGERIIMIMLALCLLFFVISTYTFMEARNEIARMNVDSIERCYILDCTILPFGKIQCRQAGISDTVDTKNLLNTTGFVI